MTFSIAGKTAIVTGAAHNCGLEIGRYFLEQGAKVVFADCDEAALERLMSDIGGPDRDMRIFAGDLCKKLAIANLLSTTLADFDRVDILVNASLHYSASDPLEQNSDALNLALEKNVMAPYRMSQAVAKQMLKQDKYGESVGSGSIINLSSIAARHTRPDILEYSVSVAALEQMTRALSVAFAPSGLRVNGIAVGSIHGTPLDERLAGDESLYHHVVQATPMDRIGYASEITHTAQYLASDASSFVTGQIVTVDGGRSLLDPLSVFERS